MLSVDFLPDASDSKLEQQFREHRCAMRESDWWQVLSRIGCRGDSSMRLLVRAEIALDRRVAELSAIERGRLIDQLKRCRNLHHRQPRV